MYVRLNAYAINYQGLDSSKTLITLSFFILWAMSPQTKF
ncbi:hypothetical protein VCHA52P453_210081 [Vibrio chagasii]|nr:hypothetical protein VCHA34P115_40080 [Vibrio chagasii]CAH7161368.1 hypothetical protein VCHA52P453_210081 [Vibrio chagasii]CAH7320824.1 hypothetical protein VCHA52P456_40228 [Vibrio chagasii]